MLKWFQFYFTLHLFSPKKYFLMIFKCLKHFAVHLAKSELKTNFCFGSDSEMIDNG